MNFKNSKPNVKQVDACNGYEIEHDCEMFNGKNDLNENSSLFNIQTDQQTVVCKKSHSIKDINN